MPFMSKGAAVGPDRFDCWAYGLPFFSCAKKADTQGNTEGRAGDEAQDPNAGVRRCRNDEAIRR